MKKIIAGAIVAAVASMTAIVPAWSAEECAPGKDARSFNAWSNVDYAAAMAADRYVQKMEVFQAMFINATYDVTYENGDYFLLATNESRTGSTSTAKMRVNFDFCADPDGMDVERKDLFTVLYATFNGRKF